MRSARESSPQRLLRVVAGPEDLGASPERLTLSEFFARHFRPGRLLRPGRERSEATIRQYGESVELWCRATGDPPLELVDEMTLGAFESSLAARRWRGQPISAQTQTKHLRHCQAVLRLAGPRDGRNRRGPAAEGFFGRDRSGMPRPAPFFDPPDPTTDGATGVLELAEIDRWMELCAAARRPQVGWLAAPDWWRLLIIWLYNTGFRIGSALAARRDQIEGGWLILQRRQMKGRRHGHRVWLNRYAAAVVREIAAARPNVAADATIFGWPWSLNWFQACRRRLVEPAGPKLAGRLKPHGLRKALATYLAAENDAVARLVCGHSSGDVLAAHYTHRRATRRLLESVPQPRWAIERFGALEPVGPQNTVRHLPRPDGQMRLF